MTAFMTMDQAAAELGISRRTLTSLISRHPHYVQGGKAKQFYPEDIESLHAAIRSESGELPLPALRLATAFYPTPSTTVAILQHNSRLTALARESPQLSTYFCGAHGFVKIGKAQDATRRLRELQTSCPNPLVILGFASLPEQDVHDRLMAHHHRAEWFRLTAPVIDFIVRNCVI